MDERLALVTIPLSLRDCTLHGPLQIGSEVAINHHCILDGGRAGIKLHDQVRIALLIAIYMPSIKAWI